MYVSTYIQIFRSNEGRKAVSGLDEDKESHNITFHRTREFSWEQSPQLVSRPAV